MGLVRKIFHLGLAISSKHLLEIAAEMGNTVTESSRRKFIVYTLILRYGLFTTVATDNINVNPKSSLHRTVTCINQQIHELYGNAPDTSKTVSIEAELRNLVKFQASIFTIESVNGE